MEILLAIVASLALQAIKFVSKKLGKEATKNVILLGLFALSIVFVLVTESNLVTVEALNKFVELLLLSVGVYEALIKRLGPFLFEKAKLAGAKLKGRFGKK